MQLTVLADALAPVLRELVDATAAPILLRLEALERRLDASAPGLAEVRREIGDLGVRLEQHVADAIAVLPKAVDVDISLIDRRIDERFAALPTPKDGQSVTVDDVRPMVGDVVAAAMATLRLPEDGKDADPAAVKQMIDAAVAAQMPAPERVDREEIAILVNAAVERALADRPTTGGPDEIRAIVDAAVERAIGELPSPKDGQSVTAEDLRPMVDATVSKAISDLPPAKDGEDGKSVSVDDVLPIVKGAIEEAALEIEGRLLARLGEAVADLPKPSDGKDADPAVVQEMVAKAVAAIPPAKDGSSITIEDVTPLIEETIARKVAALPSPKDGQSVTAEDLRPMVGEIIAAGFATLRVPEDGKDADPEVTRSLVLAEVAKAVAALPAPNDGKDVDLSAVGAMVVAEVEKILATWPRPKDGVSVTADDLKDAIAIEAKLAVELLRIQDGKDGVGVAGALIDREGELALTLSDGAVAKLGRIVGKDGEPGKPGLNGLGFDDLDVVDSGATFTLRFARGDQVKEWTLAKPTLADFYRGVWREGAFKAGDAVTWGGSLWIAQRATEAKPETNDDWRLAVKRGRDGKSVETGPRAPQQVKLK